MRSIERHSHSFIIYLFRGDELTLTFNQNLIKSIPGEAILTLLLDPFSQI